MTTLSLKKLHISAGTKEVVKDVSLDVSAGEIHVLMGQNGSGKSSLLGGVFGHPKYTITSGSVLLDENDITDSDPEEKAQDGLFLSMQYLPDIPGVPLSSFLHKAHRSITGEQVSIMDFQDLLNEKAGQLGINPQFLLRDVNVGLSGGEKKLSEVLQLAVLEPKIACLDEIDSGVDVDSLRKVFRAIKALQQKGTGFVLVTHYNAVLDHITPDHVHVMHDGKMIATGDGNLAATITKDGYRSLIPE